MLVKYLFILSLFCGSVCSYSQNGIDVIQLLNLQEEVQQLEKKISRDIKKDPILSKESGLKQFYVFWLCYPDTLEKKDFLNHSFLYKLHPYYYTINSRSIFKKRIKFVAVDVLVSDSVGHLVALGNYSSFGHSNGVRKDYIELTKMLYNKDFDFVFYILFEEPRMVRFSSTYIALKDDDIYVLKTSIKELKKYTLEEFWELQDKKWFPSLYE